MGGGGACVKGFRVRDPFTLSSTSQGRMTRHECMHSNLQEGQPEDLEERKNWPWWKATKWVLNILYHLFSRYGSSKVHTKGSNEHQFGERWQVCSTQFLEDHMAIAARLTQVRALLPPPPLGGSLIGAWCWLKGSYFQHAVVALACQNHTSIEACLAQMPAPRYCRCRHIECFPSLISECPPLTSTFSILDKVYGG